MLLILVLGNANSHVWRQSFFSLQRNQELDCFLNILRLGVNVEIASPRTEIVSIDKASLAASRADAVLCRKGPGQPIPYGGRAIFKPLRDDLCIALLDSSLL